MKIPTYIKEDVVLAPLTTFQIGGTARYFACCRSESEVTEALGWSRAASIPVFVLGDGSNLVVSDDGFAGLVLQVAINGLEQKRHDDFVRVTAAAGVNWDEFVMHSVNHEFSGIECLSGIPGRVGAAPIQNIGAYGQEVAETIQYVRVISIEDGTVTTFSSADCSFGYRTSVFKTEYADRYVVVAVTFDLVCATNGRTAHPDINRVFSAKRTEDAPPTLSEVRNAVLAVRKTKSMVLDDTDPNRRSAGSFFLNPIVSAALFDQVKLAAREAGVNEVIPTFAQPGGDLKIPAAWLIEHAGFSRGTIDGSVGISTRHALALINRGGAKASDLMRFASVIRKRVQAIFGVTLYPEPVLLGFGADVDALLA